MASPAEKLARSLEVLRDLQDGSRSVFRTEEFSRTHRDRLRGAGFLKDIIRGWVWASSPEAPGRGETDWFSAFWEFCGRYADHRFGDNWWLSPAASTSLHAENWQIPEQLIIHSPDGTNNAIALPGKTGILDLKVEQTVPGSALLRLGELNVLTKAEAIARLPVGYFRSNLLEVQSVLASLDDPGPLVRVLLRSQLVASAGRLAGAFRAIGREAAAREVLDSMRASGFDVRLDTPPEICATYAGARSPLAARVKALWAASARTMAESMPAPSSNRGSVEDILGQVDERYTADAYHSLSIEGYRVSPELIERVRSGAWDPESPADRNHRDAMAARGYWLAFREVRNSLKQVLEGGNAAGILRNDHGGWYRALFQPSVSAGISPAEALAGYRDGPVYIQGSKHVPPRRDSVADGMEALFECVEAEGRRGVSAVLTHWLLGYIHPYSDGNGRMARFAMNFLLVSAGYRWTIVPIDRRAEYMAALESASVDTDIRPFAQLVAALMGASGPQAR